MAEQSPSVEIAPTIVISNSDEGEENAGQSVEPNSGDELAPPARDDDPPQSEQVAIAEIEAERDITLAAISSDVERERIELETARVEAATDTNEELEACRREIAILAEKLETLENLLTPQPPLEVVEVTEELETAPEQNLIQPSTVVQTAEQNLENSEESLDEEAEEIIPSRVRKFIAI